MGSSQILGKNYRLIIQESYFSNGVTSEQKKIGYVKDSKGERGRFVQYKNMAPVKRVDNVDVVKSLLGIKSRPEQTKPKATKPRYEQTKPKASKPRPEHKKQKARK